MTHLWRLVVPGKQFQRLMGPMVYVWWSATGCEYVGHSRNGLRRITAGNHEHLAGLVDDDTLEVYPCRTLEAAKRLERDLIRRWRPARNALLNRDEPPVMDKSIPRPPAPRPLTMRQRFAASELGHSLSKSARP